MIVIVIVDVIGVGIGIGIGIVVLKFVVVIGIVVVIVIGEVVGIVTVIVIYILLLTFFFQTKKQNFLHNLAKLFTTLRVSSRASATHPGLYTVRIAAYLAAATCERDRFGKHYPCLSPSVSPPRRGYEQSIFF